MERKSINFQAYALLSIPAECDIDTDIALNMVNAFSTCYNGVNINAGDIMNGMYCIHVTFNIEDFSLLNNVINAFSLMLQQANIPVPQYEYSLEI